jgi:hypothetical protein
MYTEFKRSPREMFSQRAWPKPVEGVEISAQLAIQQIRGWERLFEETYRDPKSTRSPFWWGGDNPKEALQSWAQEQELSTSSLVNDEGYKLGFHTSMEILHLSVLRTSALLRGCSVEEIIAGNPEFPSNTPSNFCDLLRQTEKLVREKSGLIEDPKEPQLVIYSSPRFFPERSQESIEALLDRLVIDPKKMSPQNGIGYRFSAEHIQEMCYGFSSKLITLEIDKKIHGIYFLHLSFPEEPTSLEMFPIKTKAKELGLLSSSQNELEDLSISRLINYRPTPSRTAWADLVAISDHARQFFKEAGVHVYSSVHKSMYEMCKIYGVERLLGTVRIGANENLAWEKSHQRQGWQMPQEELQRNNPLKINGNDYAIISLDIV